MCAEAEALTYRDWYKQHNRTPANRPIPFSSSDDEDDDSYHDSDDSIVTFDSGYEPMWRPIFVNDDDDDEVVVPSPITTTTTVNDDTNDESDNGCKSSGFCFGGCSYVKCK